MTFKEINSQMNLPEVEKQILDFWQKEDIFNKTLEKTKEGKPYHFYDGPPFATGTPHYGHIVASTMKDTVPRYWTMRGRYVERKWGWDCHGLPIENIAEKELGVEHKKDIEEKIGVAKFNETCRSMVLSYVDEWERVIARLGRWADMKNAYKTMDLSYMESVWWVFKELWDKGLIYEGYRSMHICPRCETTLSQSEVTEGYRMVKDLSAIAKFELIDESDTFVLAWTTTPWTLIGNVALAVGGEIKYVTVISEGDSNRYILAKERVESVFKDRQYKIVDEFKGHDLVGKAYRPLFDYYSTQQGLSNAVNGWKIYPADFVTTEDGTGVVHIAPAFGDDDMKLGTVHNLPFVQHVGMDGIIEKEAGEFAGMHVKPKDDVQKTDVEIIKYLAHNNLLFSKEKYEHSYPHCWRCDTPLLNYATSSWFVAITKIKEKMLDLAKEINWSPAHIKEGRFGKWLEGARDWSISRQRYWASVMPIWKCNCGEIFVVGSKAELEKLSGQKVDDLHKDVVDQIKIPCLKCKGEMTRIPDVLDTWFDSGSMPYAQLHYPFENKEKFDKSFPAEFIAEGQDQCRAWFYYLHVLSSGIKESVAFKNVIVNGIVLAEDGKKMSKKLQNYPDPMLMFDKYGVDTVRFYLLGSPVMQAENLNFSEKEVAELHRGIFRMIWNSYSFFTLYANIDGWKHNGSEEKSDNFLDRWIISELNRLIEEVNKAMENYDLTRATRLFAPFVDDLSNWYIRRSRKRFWKPARPASGSENDNDKNNAYQTLWTVLVELSKLLAPFTPFLADEIYKNLTGDESVHLASYPQVKKELIDKNVNEEMASARTIVEVGLSKRAEAKIKVRQPLLGMVYGGKQLEAESESIILDEVNVKNIRFDSSLKSGEVEIDTNITEELKIEGFAREIVRNIQSLRKKTGLNVDDRIEVYYETDFMDLNSAIKLDFVSKEVLATKLINKKEVSVQGSEEFNIDQQKVWIGINKA